MSVQFYKQSDVARAWSELADVDKVYYGMLDLPGHVGTVRTKTSLAGQSEMRWVEGDGPNKMRAISSFMHETEDDADIWEEMYPGRWFYGGALELVAEDPDKIVRGTRNPLEHINDSFSLDMSAQVPTLTVGSGVAPAGPIVTGEKRGRNLKLKVGGDVTVDNVDDAQQLLRHIGWKQNVQVSYAG